jgi:phosphoglucomutase
VYKELLKLYVAYGFYKEHLISITKKGMLGLDVINQLMVSLREAPLQEINSQKVIRIEDYSSSLARNLVTGVIENLTLPKADVLIYYTEDGSKICARPSGTEPKIKFYISVNSKLDCIENFKVVEKPLNEKIKNISSHFQL